MSDYLLFNLFPNQALVEAAGVTQVLIGNDKDHLATRVSYKLNLKGPSITVSTACSTSLVAVHLACQSLLSRECDMMVAGAVSIGVRQKAGYLYQPGGIQSPDGHCRAFDEKAQGTISGNGVGIVILKRLVDALTDGDTIHAVIKGSAINNDGALKAGYTAPSVEGQAAVIAEAQAVAATPAETITYVETHGTGTPLGDLIEITALTKAFRLSTTKKGFCAIGSVKTNIGHLDAAAGMAGLIKTVQALKYRMIPPSLHYEEPNAQIAFDESPFFVNTELREWQGAHIPRRAGISSFGLGGTNAHLVLEEAPIVERTADPRRSNHLLVLSAKSANALENATANLLDHLRRHPDMTLADLAYTSQVGRKVFNYRRTFICQDISDVIACLQTLDPTRVATAFQEMSERPAVFMFPGGGTQRVYMGRELYQKQAIFREQVDLCARLLKPHLGIDLRSILYPKDTDVDAATQALKAPSTGLPALFAVDYALAVLWMSWGILPAAMIGHSVGEYVAACLAGVMSLEDALALVALRGRLFETLPAGAMLSVPFSAEQLSPLLGEQLFLASVNGPSICVVSGSLEALSTIEESLEKEGVKTYRLDIDVAAHSPIVEPILEKFTAFLRGIRLRAPQLPYISNVTGTWITTEQATDPSYWGQHLRQTVQLSAGISELLRDQKRVFIEVGPGRSLSSMVKQQGAGSNVATTVLSLPPPHDSQGDLAFILHSFGQLWLAGVKVEWLKFHQSEQGYLPRRIPLPTYPFERQRYWIEAPDQGNTPVNTSFSLRRQRTEKLADWFYIPSWKNSLPPSPARIAHACSPKETFLIFDNRGSLSHQLTKRLKDSGHDVVIVTIDTQYHQGGEATFAINPEESRGYTMLLQTLKEQGKVPTRIVHCWSLSTESFPPLTAHLFQECQRYGYYSLLFLAQAIATAGIEDRLSLTVISNKLYDVSGDEMIVPEKITLLAPCMVIPQEYTNITCSSIDIVQPQPGTVAEERLLAQLLAEIEQGTHDLMVAYRGNRRLIRTYEAARFEDTATNGLRQHGTYLIIGGLGKVGLLLAQHLARTVKARLILLSRTRVPDRSEWPQWVDSHSEDTPMSRVLKTLLILETVGVEVMTLSADVADEEQMQLAIQQAEARFKKIHGVFYAAGITKAEAIARPITQTGYSESEQQFQAKVYGLYVLQKILQGRVLDFCLLFSSNASVLGGLGLVGYAASNLFLDTFVAHHNKAGGQRWVSANWDGWLDEEETRRRAREVHTSTEQYAMTPTESLEALQRILCSAKVDQVIVSAGDLLARYHLWLQNPYGKAAENQEKVFEREEFYPRPELRSDYVAPRSELEQTIATAWSKFLGVTSIGINDNFFELGGHSLLAIQLLSYLCTTLQVELSLRDLLEKPNIAELALLVEKRSLSGRPLDAFSPSALVAIQPKGSRRPFFCVHPQGGGVTCYLPLSRYLGMDQPFYGLEEPSYTGKQEPFTSIEEAAMSYIAAIRSIQPRGPYLMGGWSLGGIIAAEMSYQLYEQGEETALLALLDSPSPLPAGRLLTDEEWTALLLIKAGRSLRKQIPFEKLRKLGVSDQIRYLLEQVRYDDLKQLGDLEQLEERLKQTQEKAIEPIDVVYLHIQRFLRIAKAQALAMRDYPHRIYPCRLTLFRASDKQTAAATLKDHPAFEEPSFGWEAFSSRPVNVVAVPGDHDSMVELPHVQVLAEQLTSCILHIDTEIEAAGTKPGDQRK